MRWHMAYGVLMVVTTGLAAVLLTVLVDPTVAGVSLNPLRRMLILSSALPLMGSSACLILWWVRYTVGMSDRHGI